MKGYFCDTNETTVAVTRQSVIYGPVCRQTCSYSGARMCVRPAHLAPRSTRASKGVPKVATDDVARAVAPRRRTSRSWRLGCRSFRGKKVQESASVAVVVATSQLPAAEASVDCQATCRGAGVPYVYHRLCDAAKIATGNGTTLLWCHKAEIEGPPFFFFDAVKMPVEMRSRHHTRINHQHNAAFFLLVETNSYFLSSHIS